MKLGVCVPYRNREEHLKEFIPKVGKYLTEQGIEHEFFIAHQVDDKLFNRGAMKNIAAKHAFENGCDYIVWHDVDMIPEDGCDYSFPTEGPRHIATKISQMDYKLKYYEYFGGAVIFSKEQVEKTNGYSNDYWDWGMEDDDLFWRCILEDLVDTKYEVTKKEYQTYLEFDGEHSYVRIPYRDEFKRITTKSHTVSVLVRANQQPQKNDVYLIGDGNKKYVEYPIFRVPGYDYGFSFNNSRAMSLMYWDIKNNFNYMWGKRYDNQWTILTATFDTYNCISRFFINGIEVNEEDGLGSKSPHHWGNSVLKHYRNYDWYLGVSPGLPKKEKNKFFKGDIGGFFFWDRILTDDELKKISSDAPVDDCVISLDFNNPFDFSKIECYNTKIQTDNNFKIPKSILPFRKEGRMFCLPHKDEGLVDGEWAKGETTARNERRYVLEMQQGKINYKEDGIKQLKYDVDSIDVTDNVYMLNVKL
jgi:hypothetical protein